MQNPHNADIQQSARWYTFIFTACYPIFTGRRYWNELVEIQKVNEEPGF